MTTIVFSKDRAMQLHAFLRSYQMHVTPLEPIHVLYTATSIEHYAAYDAVFSLFDFVVPRIQLDIFKRVLLDLLPTQGNVVFFVDDQLFIRDWVVVEKPGLSLRLGVHLTHNYASHDAPQPLPRFQQDGEYLTWSWALGQLAWNYPLSLDGHLFDLGCLRPILEALDYHSPNTLEAALQLVAPQYQTMRGSCYQDARVVNVPWNIVQSDWYNRNAGSTATHADEMRQWWEQGLQISLQDIDGVYNESTHQVFPLVLENRHGI